MSAGSPRATDVDGAAGVGLLSTTCKSPTYPMATCMCLRLGITGAREAALPWHQRTSWRSASASAHKVRCDAHFERHARTPRIGRMSPVHGAR